MTKQKFLGLIGDRVRRAREAAGMSQIDLASAAGMRQSAVSDIEHGQRDLRLDSMRRVAAGLHLRLADLVDLDTTR